MGPIFKREAREFWLRVSRVSFRVSPFGFRISSRVSLRPEVLIGVIRIFRNSDFLILSGFAPPRSINRGHSFVSGFLIRVLSFRHSSFGFLFGFRHSEGFLLGFRVSLRPEVLIGVIRVSFRVSLRPEVLIGVIRISDFSRISSFVIRISFGFRSPPRINRGSFGFRVSLGFCHSSLLRIYGFRSARVMEKPPRRIRFWNHSP